MTTITKEWLQQTIAEFENTRDDIPFGLDDDDAKILIVLKRALASLEAEPVAYNQVQRYMMKDIIVRKLGSNLLGHKLMMADIHAVTMALIQAGFRTAPPASERERIRREHAEWSDKTFGDVGPVGPLKHLSKEALEAAAEPGDLSEWADMQFLLWDAQRRAGISDGEITAAMEEKLKVNMARQWPEPKDGEPRLHIKEQPAPIVPETLPCSVELKPGLIIGKGCKTETLLTALKRRADYYAELEALTPEQRAEHDVGIAEFIKSFGNSEQLNSPVTPDDWVMVPKEPTQAMINAWLSEVADWRGHVAGYKAMLAAAPEKETGPCTK
ncbi:DUF550 domain-containing protein [Salmonella enterica]|nr:DUF550 domain-containing protein [Salmonella enterica]EMD4121962.1 DUF550 domain-containing protein [Salmonella enterica]EMD4298179.1 DUF550 domain-containing protein [Salmonella enterica]EMD4434694.1 DUF550 domain-containing protein [Salmonella enterica]